MTSRTPEPYEEELLRRARQLIEGRGKSEIRVDKAHEDPFLTFRDERIAVAVKVATNELSIALKFEGRSGYWLVYWDAVSDPRDSIFMPEHYQECVELMRRTMVLEDLADV